MRITFPVAVILNRLAAPRCVLSLSFFGFFPTKISSLKFFSVGQASACQLFVQARRKTRQAEACPTAAAQRCSRPVRWRERPPVSRAPCRHASARAAPSRHLLPCAVRFRPARDPQFPPAAGAFSHGPLPGGPFRDRDERSWP